MIQTGFMKGIVPGIFAGFIFLAYVGVGAGPLVLAEDDTLINTLANGMIDLIGGMFGAGALVRFILHILISAIIGSFYTGFFLLLVNLGSNFLNILVGGLIYGLIWWIVGGNIIMPHIIGGEILQLTLGPSFFGHIIFGHTLAFLVLQNRTAGLYGSNFSKFPRLEHPAGYVYNVYDDKTGLNKIGRTIDPQQRIRQLRREHGSQLQYKSLIESDNAPKDESRLHKKHDSRRKDGEWFDMK